MILMPVKVFTHELNVPSRSYCISLPWVWKFWFSQGLTLGLRCFIKFFPASLLILGEILSFVTGILSNSEFVCYPKKQTSLSWEHPELPVRSLIFPLAPDGGYTVFSPFVCASSSPLPISISPILGHPKRLSVHPAISNPPTDPPFSSTLLTLHVFFFF